MSARVLSAVLSTLTVPLVYLIGRILWGRRTAAFAAGLVAISAYSVFLGRLALLDAAATFFVTAAVLFLILWQRHGSVRWLALFAVTTCIAAETKVTSVLLVAVFIAVVVADKSWRRLGTRSVVIASVAGAARPHARRSWRWPASAGTLSSFLGTSVQRHSPVPWTYYFTTLWDYSGAPFLILIGVGLVAVVVRPRTRGCRPVGVVRVLRRVPGGLPAQGVQLPVAAHSRSGPSGRARPGHDPCAKGASLIRLGCAGPRGRRRLDPIPRAEQK